MNERSAHAGPSAACPSCPACPARRQALQAWVATGASALAMGTGLWALPVQAADDAVQTLKAFARDVQAARGEFTQTVVSPDGQRKKVSSGQFAFSRPNRFRFAYDKPFEQLIVADGQKVWLHDIDLNQVNVRPIDQALGATPAALLAGGSLERDFSLKAEPDANGQQWVAATPRQADGQVKLLRVGFKGGVLATLELTDAFGQRSTLQFSRVEQGAKLAPELFRFSPPKGADVVGG